MARHPGPHGLRGSFKIPPREPQHLLPPAPPPGAHAGLGERLQREGSPAVMFG